MNVEKDKKKHWQTVKEILFAYLAISKLMTWGGYFQNLGQGNLWDDIALSGERLLSRLLNQDLMLISGVILFFFLERLIYAKNKDGGVVKLIGKW